MKWWFKYNWWLPVKILILCGLVYQFFSAIILAGVQTTASLSLLKVWLGWVCLLIFGIGIILWTFITPLLIAASCVAVFPITFTDPDKTKRVALFQSCLYSIILSVFFIWNGFVITKFADLDPNKAWMAGVCGTVPPEVLDVQPVK